MKGKAFLIVFIILVSLIPVYFLNKYFQKIIQPRKSFARLTLYLFSGFALVFICTFLVVFIIKKIFPGT